eukprot:3502936-Rhodomonas_salina.1
MDPAEAQLLLNTVAELQQQLTDLQNAAPAAGTGTAVPELDAAALAAAISSTLPPKDHSKDLDYIEVFSAEGTMHPDNFIKNVEGTFNLKNTPEEDKVCLVASVPSLSSKALSVFKAFKNAVGDINDCSTITWPKFKQLMLGLLPDLSIDSYNIIAEYNKLLQTSLAEKFVKKYHNIVSRIFLNLEAAKLHTNDSLILCFIGKLKM